MVSVLNVIDHKFSCEKLHWVESAKYYPSESFLIYGS